MMRRSFLAAAATLAISSTALGATPQVTPYMPRPATVVPPAGVLDPPPDTGAPKDPASLSDVTNPDSDFYKSRGTFEEEGGIRARTLADAARGVGIRAGYADEARRINAVIQRLYARELERQFDFRGLLLRDGTIVPPVVTAISTVEETSGDSFLYTSIGAYEIVSDARVAIRSPTWRDYLVLPVADPAPPQGLEPVNSDEKDLWRRSAAEGWDKGIQEAREEFNSALSRLIRDRDGMIRYRDLQRQGVLSLPTINTRRAGYRATADGRRAFFGETAIRITVMPKFRAAAARGRRSP